MAVVAVFVAVVVAVIVVIVVAMVFVVCRWSRSLSLSLLILLYPFGMVNVVHVLFNVIFGFILLVIIIHITCIVVVAHLGVLFSWFSS